jgi:hypothetical protein
MKQIILSVFAIAAVAASSCNNKKPTENNTVVEATDNQTTTAFTVDGKEYNGKVSTQYFGSNKETDNFSVLCQQDEPLVLLQATFANEKDAKSGTALKVKGGSYKTNAGEFGLSLSITGLEKEFIANEKSTGILKVEGNKMSITNMKLFDQDGKEKVVNATITF